MPRFLIDNDAPDTILGPPDEWGIRQQISIAARPTPDGFPSPWHRQRYQDDLRRELQGIAFRLQHLDDPPMPWQEPPTREQLDRARMSLENTYTAIVAELARLDEPVKDEPVKGARSGKAA